MSDDARTILIAGAIFMALAVVLGAFGAHALKKKLPEEMLAVYNTAVDYHFIHAMGILVIGLFLQSGNPSGLLSWAAICLVFGILLFSGSLYALSITGIRKLGMVTPLGGLAFITGWVLLAIGIYRMN